MAAEIFGVLAVKSLISAQVWSAELAAVSYQASLHVRTQERRPFTPGEDRLQRYALGKSAWFVLALPLVGSLGAAIWPGIALPRNGNFPGAESFRSRVRRLCARVSLWDLPLLLLFALYYAFNPLIR